MNQETTSKKRKFYDIDEVGTSKVQWMGEKTIDDMTIDEISVYFHLPSTIACVALNTEMATLTSRCRELGLKRWPYNAKRERKIHSYHGGQYFGEFQVTEPIFTVPTPNYTTPPINLPPISELIHEICISPKRVLSKHTKKVH
jgi:hypothetical protein